MNRIKCMVVDDEQASIDLLCGLISRQSDLALVNTTTDPLKALAMVDQYEVKLLFADLHMEGMHGIELIRKLSNKVQVICCTAYNHYGPQLSELDVAFYLEKPVSQKMFDLAVDRVLKREAFQQWQEGFVPALNLADECSLRTPGKKNWIRLKLVDIECLEAKEKLTEITYTDGVELVDYSLGELEQLLPKAYFMRVHKSYMVPLKRIGSYSVFKGIRLRGSSFSTSVPVGRVYRESVQQFIERRELNRINDGRTNTK
jgi:two-component system, LytTR family, response regulator